ncbi:hypothetical protein B296_00017335 [Ensete ventricosum]|uniref:Uncharacterized protein n=1 Tax=Ensete ventricosum TaxID=4639 RepID=A0A427AJV9_ENSVE|nr:hypothetical protein B296_00017335 [Ensete ventricosum]
MCIDHFEARQVVSSSPSFPPRHLRLHRLPLAYEVVVQVSLTSASGLSYLCLFVGEVAYKILWYSSRSEWVSFAMASNAMVGSVTACTLELASDIQ